MVILMNIYSWSALVLYDILIIFSHVFKRISFYSHQLLTDKEDSLYIHMETFEVATNSVIMLLLISLRFTT